MTECSENSENSKTIQNQSEERTLKETMAKFNVLQYNQRFMAKIAIHSYRLTEPTNEFFKSPVPFIILFLLSVGHVISSGVFVYRNFRQFEVALQAIFVMIGGFQGLGMYLSVGLKMKKVKLLQLKLQQIVDEGESLRYNLHTHNDNLKIYLIAIFFPFFFSSVQ